MDKLIFCFKCIQSYNHQINFECRFFLTTHLTTTNTGQNILTELQEFVTEKTMKSNCKSTWISFVFINLLIEYTNINELNKS